MKRFELLIDSIQANWIFSPIRHRIDIAQLLMKTIKLFLVNCPPTQEMAAGKIILNISKMNRLFFVSEKKIFSINFPYAAATSEQGFEFKASSGSSIDNKTTSEILQLLSGSAISSSSIYEFADDIIDVADHSPDIWMIFRDLLMNEDGYLRYDYDNIRQNGHIHPLNHLDVFYSSSSTFKIGLDSEMRNDLLIDILDIGSECHYLRPPN